MLGTSEDGTFLIDHLHWLETAASGGAHALTVNYISSLYTFCTAEAFSPAPC